MGIEIKVEAMTSSAEMERVAERRRRLLFCEKGAAKKGLVNPARQQGINYHNCGTLGRAKYVHARKSPAEAKGACLSGSNETRTQERAHQALAQQELMCRTGQARREYLVVKHSPSQTKSALSIGSVVFSNVVFGTDGPTPNGANPTHGIQHSKRSALPSSRALQSRPTLRVYARGCTSCKRDAALGMGSKRYLSVVVCGVSSAQGARTRGEAGSVVPVRDCLSALMTLAAAGR